MSERRCPHDGGYCHHGCGCECFREASGCKLSTPHKDERKVKKTRKGEKRDDWRTYEKAAGGR